MEKEIWITSSLEERNDYYFINQKPDGDSGLWYFLKLDEDLVEEYQSTLKRLEELRDYFWRKIRPFENRQHLCSHMDDVYIGGGEDVL